MPLTLPTELLQLALERMAEREWVWCWKITADVTASATSVFQITNYPEELILEGDTYQPFAMQHGVVTKTREGRLLELEVRVSNATRELTLWLEKGRGFASQPALAKIGHKDELAQGPVETLRFTVGNVIVTNELVTFQLQTPNYFLAMTPRDSFENNRCPWRFQSVQCGYVGLSFITPGNPGNLNTCNKTLVDCIERGDDEVALGKPRLHPRRFGAFPGIPRRLR